MVVLTRTGAVLGVTPSTLNSTDVPSAYLLVYAWTGFAKRDNAHRRLIEIAIDHDPDDRGIRDLSSIDENVEVDSGCAAHGSPRCGSSSRLVATERYTRGTRNNGPRSRHRHGHVGEYADRTSTFQVSRY
jgi:hypothetical protein